MELNIDKMNEGLKNSSAGKIITHISKFPNPKIAHYSTSKALFDGIIVGDAKKGKEIIRVLNKFRLDNSDSLHCSTTDSSELFRRCFRIKRPHIRRMGLAGRPLSE